ncbi:histidinol-phosphate transaminase [Actinomadura welshii]|uniref:Aromatic amino acid aminotransferase n=2 Tax=Actinomadura livida TaxID=79909 RepID=A0A7W7I8H0_9ACTN|nr:histidinol-phosphate transaminase [Actinomadura catellatispora]MBB4772390.1 histidinol-phosphate aminotransferase [Actinomadura catellatispora]
MDERSGRNAAADDPERTGSTPPRTATIPRFRPVVGRFLDYRPAAEPEARGALVKLSQNESPYGPLPSVEKALAAGLRGINRYPDNHAVPLVEALAGRLRVPDESVVVGAGAVGVIQMLLQAVAEPGAEIMYAWRSFEAYPLLVSLAGMANVQVPLREERHDLAAMADAVTERTRLVFVCNPNNPTGTVVSQAELTAFLDRVPSTCLVVLDEAYQEYVRDPEAADGLALWRDHPNLVAVRTFSKAYGLAGLRVGYLVGHPAVAEAVRKHTVPYSVNGVAQAAALASLAAEDELLERVETTVKERARVAGALLEQGWDVPGSEGNFVWLRLGERTADFADACASEGVCLRPFAGTGVRVSIGCPEENDAFIAVAADYVRRGADVPVVDP